MYKLIATHNTFGYQTNEINDNGNHYKNVASEENYKFIEKYYTIK